MTREMEKESSKRVGLDFVPVGFGEGRCGRLDRV
jgi:hypothetical protein